MKEVTKEEFLSLFDPTISWKIIEAIKRYPDAVAVVRFVNMDMSSSSLGQSSALVVGPSNTFKSIEDCKGKWLNDLPSQRQYPDEYCLRDELLK